MITMDVKGITWVGNVYHKFEAICLEVEEIMYQDTVKYVENQVQTVGLSVEQFCSDVMQDLLPAPSMDPLKVEVSDLPVGQYADVGICKKPKVGVNENPLKVDVGKLTEDLKVIPDMDKNGSHEPSPHDLRNVDNLFPPSSVDPVDGTFSNLYHRQYDDGIMHNKSKLGVRENSEKENLPATEMPGAITQMYKDLSRASSSCGPLNENLEVSCGQTAVTSTPAPLEVKGCDFIEESCNEIENASKCISDVSVNGPLSDMIILVESVGNRMEKNLSPGGLSAESNAADTCTNSGMVSPVGSTGNEKEFADNVFVSCPGRSYDGVSDTINTVAGDGMDSNKVKLEESCVLVNGDGLNFVPLSAGNCRPNKKKLQDAFSSRMRSARKQEYVKLAVWHGDDAKSNQECVESLIPSHDFCELEWEIL